MQRPLGRFFCALYIRVCGVLPSVDSKQLSMYLCLIVILKIQGSMMSCEDAWSVEIMGSFGWERTATVFMENGKYLGAGANHYSVGSYKQDGDDLEISLTYCLWNSNSDGYQ
jgi:hypothetical protein